MVDDKEAGPSTSRHPLEDSHQDQAADAAPASGFTYVQRNKRLHGRRARGKKNGAGQPSGEGEEESQPSIEQLLDLIRAKKQALSQGQYGAALEECIDAFARARCGASPSRPGAASDHAASDHAASAQAAFTSVLPGASPSAEDKTSAASPARWIPDRIVALGMGRVSQSRSAQIQLALLLIMADLFEVRGEVAQQRLPSADALRSPHQKWSTPASTAAAEQGDQDEASDVAGPSSSESTRPQLLAFDPLSGPMDNALLTAFGVTAASRSDVSPAALFPPLVSPTSSKEQQEEPHDEDAANPVSFRTLLYMPHCPRQLYEAYLRASLFPPSSSSSPPRTPQHNISLLSNRLSRYVDLCPSPARLAREAPALWRTASYMERSWVGVPQAKVEVVKGQGEALSDLGFQWFDAERGEDKRPTEQGDGEGDEDVDGLADGMATVALAGKGRRRRRVGRDGGAAADGPPRPDPSTADFWTLPEPVPSEADGEVL